MTKILITGSGGFIGKHLSKALSSNSIIKFCKSLGQDILNLESLKQIKDISLIYHLAAMTSISKCEKDSQKAFDINIQGTKNVLELARLNNAKIIFMSSTAVYGAPKYLPVDENHPTNPVNIYGETKLKAENLILEYSKKYQIPYLIIRGFNIYGPDQNELFLIPKIIKQLKGGKVTLFDPRPKRDYVHISDVVSALIKAKDCRQNTIINIGSGKSYSVEEIVNLLRVKLRLDTRIEYLNKIRKNEILDIYADISKAKELLDWEPKTLLVNGIRELYYHE